MARFERSTLLAKFQYMIENRQPIIGGGAGNGADTGEFNRVQQVPGALLW